jgi:hypothetical protein
VGITRRREDNHGPLQGTEALRHGEHGEEKALRKKHFEKKKVFLLSKKLLLFSVFSVPQRFGAL